MLPLRVERDSDQLTVQLCQVFGIAKHLCITGKLFIGKAVKTLASAVTDKGGAADEIHHNAVLIFYAAVRLHTVDFALVVADDTDLFLKGVKRFNQAVNDFLQIFKRSADFSGVGELARSSNTTLIFLSSLIEKSSFHRS